MERSNRPSLTGPGRRTPGTMPAALSDAQRVARRAAVDEAAAAEARRRFRDDGLSRLQPDDRISGVLGPGEQLIAVHHHALLERREPSPGDRLTPGLVGDLYVTSRRLVLVGRLTLSFDLATLEDHVIAGDRLLLILGDGHGVAVQVAAPRVLSVEIAAVRATVRANQASAAGGEPEGLAR